MDIVNIDTAVQKEQQIVLRKKFILLNIVLICLGISSIVSAYHPDIKDSMNLSTGLWVIGLLSLIIGTVKMFYPSKYYYYLPTKEKVTRHTLYFSQKDKNKVLECIANRNLDSLQKMASKISTGIMVVVYSTPSRCCQMVQMQEYVPFKFVPLQPVQIFKEAKTE